MAAGSEFHSRPNRWGDRSILHKFTSSTLALTHSAWGEFSARVVIPDLSPVDVLAVPRAAAVLHKAARGPATSSRLDRRLQPIGGRRVQERASQRPRDKRAVVTNLRIASGCWFLVDAEVDPDGFQRNRRRNLATIARVDLCPPTLSDDVERAGPVLYRPYGIHSVRAARPSESPYIVVCITVRYRGLFGSAC